MTLNSSTSINVEWGTVEPCIHQNGAITGYSVRYGEVGTSEGERRVKMDSSKLRTLICGLTKETVYTVEVAAVTVAGIGMYSDPLIFETPNSE